jgi:hypothetical protein
MCLSWVCAPSWESTGVCNVQVNQWRVELVIMPYSTSASVQYGVSVIVL